MIANTILQQLGSHGFTVMTGSRNYINLIFTDVTGLYTRL